MEFWMLDWQSDWHITNYNVMIASLQQCSRSCAVVATMSLLPDTQNCGLQMRRECRERFSRHRMQRKPLVSDPGMHRGTCVTHVPWCMSGSLTRGGEENFPGIPGVYATRNFANLVRGPWHTLANRYSCLIRMWYDVFPPKSCFLGELCSSQMRDNTLSEPYGQFYSNYERPESCYILIITPKNDMHGNCCPFNTPKTINVIL